MDIEIVDPQSNFSITEINQTTTWTLHDDVNQSKPNLPENCLILFNRFVNWNHPGNLMSWETAELIERIKAAILIPILFILGTPANIINMIVFYKQGLKERINVCLFYMALIDLLHLTPVFIFHFEEMYGFFTDGGRYGKLFRFMVNNGVIGFFGLGYGSLLLAAIISTERCVCVLSPLTAQRCIPTKAFAIVVFVIVFTASALFFVVNRQFKVICVYEMDIQRMSWQVTFNTFFHNNQVMLSVLNGFFFGVCLSAGGPAVVLLSTIITSIKLWQIVRWRTHTSSSMSSPKEIAVTKMLITLSTVFLLLCSPVFLLRVSRLFPSFLDPHFHTNLFRSLVHITEMCFYGISIANFIVYYKTGTKYRETLHALLGIKKVDKTSSFNRHALASMSSSNVTPPS